MVNIYELLVRRCTQATIRIQFITIALVWTLKLDVKTLLPKTSHTLGAKHREFKMELIEVLSCSASLHSVSTILPASGCKNTISSISQVWSLDSKIPTFQAAYAHWHNIGMTSKEPTTFWWDFLTAAHRKSLS